MPSRHISGTHTDISLVVLTRRRSLSLHGSRVTSVVAHSRQRGFASESLEHAIAAINKIIFEQEQKRQRQRASRADASRGRVEVDVVPVSKPITFKASARTEKLVKEPAGTTSASSPRGLAAYLALPLDQYSLLDPGWISRSPAAPDAFVLRIPLFDLVGLDLQPQITVRVSLDPRKSQVHFVADQFKVGDPRIDEDFKINMRATLRNKPVPTLRPLRSISRMWSRAGHGSDGAAAGAVAAGSRRGGAADEVPSAPSTTVNGVGAVVTATTATATATTAVTTSTAEGSLAAGGAPNPPEPSPALRSRPSEVASSAATSAPSPASSREGVVEMEPVGTLGAQRRVQGVEEPNRRGVESSSFERFDSSAVLDVGVRQASGRAGGFSRNGSGTGGGGGTEGGRRPAQDLPPHVTMVSYNRTAGSAADQGPLSSTIGGSSSSSSSSGGGGGGRSGGYVGSGSRTGGSGLGAGNGSRSEPAASGANVSGGGGAMVGPGAGVARTGNTGSLSPSGSSNANDASAAEVPYSSVPGVGSGPLRGPGAGAGVPGAPTPSTSESPPARSAATPNTTAPGSEAGPRAWPPGAYGPSHPAAAAAAAATTTSPTGADTLAPASAAMPPPTTAARRGGPALPAMSPEVVPAGGLATGRAGPGPVSPSAAAKPLGAQETLPFIEDEVLYVPASQWGREADGLPAAGAVGASSGSAGGAGQAGGGAAAARGAGFVTGSTAPQTSLLADSPGEGAVGGAGVNKEAPGAPPAAGSGRVMPTLGRAAAAAAAPGAVAGALGTGTTSSEATSSASAGGSSGVDRGSDPRPDPADDVGPAPIWTSPPSVDVRPTGLPLGAAAMAQPGGIGPTSAAGSGPASVSSSTSGMPPAARQTADVSSSPAAPPEASAMAKASGPGPGPDSAGVGITVASASGSASTWAPTHGPAGSVAAAPESNKPSSHLGDSGHGVSHSGDSGSAADPAAMTFNSTVPPQPPPPSAAAAAPGSSPVVASSGQPQPEAGAEEGPASMLVGNVDVAVTVMLPPALAAVPRPLLGMAGSLVARYAISSLLPSFLDLLIADYGRWSTGQTVRAREAPAGDLVAAAAANAAAMGAAPPGRSAVQQVASAVAAGAQAPQSAAPPAGASSPVGSVDKE